MNSKSIDWERIENFVGLGTIEAPVVFIGMEEGLKSPDDLDDELHLRSTYPTDIMDLKEASRGTVGFENMFDPVNAPIQKTWKAMAHIMLRREGVKPDKEARRRYIALHLGRSEGQTLLADLLPYPHPRIDTWLYKRFKKYETREQYREAVLPRRIHLLRRVLAERPRELVVCYGKGDWDDFRRLFNRAQWSVQGNSQVAEHGTTRVVLSNHFVDWSLNSDEALDDLASVALA